MNEIKKLRRSKKDRKIAGVCGGMGEYFNTDPLWFRLAWLFAVLCAGTGILIYIIFWIVVSEE